MRLIGTLLLTLVATGCATTSTIPLPGTDTGREIGIVGYNMTDGRTFPFTGKASILADSLYLRAREESYSPGLGPNVIPPDTTLSANDVSALRIRQFSLSKTIALAAAPVVIWYVAFLLGGFQGANE